MAGCLSVSFTAAKVTTPPMAPANKVDQIVRIVLELELSDFDEICNAKIREPNLMFSR
jgi:hypothetical protein